MEPFTMAAACLVKVLACNDAHGDSVEMLSAVDEYVLKVYDRRHANNVRSRTTFWPFDMAREAEFQAFLAASRAKQGVGDCGSREPSPPEDMDVELEAHKLLEAASIHEVTGYSRMMKARASGLQPASPYYYGEIECESEIGTLRGILIEYISPRITLTDYLKRAATCGHLMADVPKICDQVVQAVESTMTFGFNHDDARMDNVLLHCENGAYSAHKGFEYCTLTS